MFATYIMSNKRRTVLYTGMTNDLIRRVFEHKSHIVKGFTRKYNCDDLLYYELFGTPMEAIAREKQIKGKLRSKKISLIKSQNPKLIDLYENLL